MSLLLWCVSCATGYVLRTPAAGQIPHIRVRPAVSLLDTGLSWIKVHSEASSDRIIEFYFGKKKRDSQKCELFLTEGVPCAAMLYSSSNSHGMPIVESFLFNEGLMLLYDVGPLMRRALYKKYRSITVRNATNLGRFISC